MPAGAIANARSSMGLRTLSQVCRHFRAIFRPLDDDNHLRTFMAQSTFCFYSSTQLNLIISNTPTARRNIVHAIQFKSAWMRNAWGQGVSEANRRRGEISALTSLANLNFIRILIGPIDDADGYGNRRWMAMPRPMRYAYYSQLGRSLNRYMRGLLQTVLIEVVVDTHAGWRGPKSREAAQTVVRLRYHQATSGRWRMVGQPDEKEDQVNNEGQTDQEEQITQAQLDQEEQGDQQEQEEQEEQVNRSEDNDGADQLRRRARLRRWMAGLKGCAAHLCG